MYQIDLFIQEFLQQIKKWSPLISFRLLRQIFEIADGEIRAKDLWNDIFHTRTICKTESERARPFKAFPEDFLRKSKIYLLENTRNGSKDTKIRFVYSRSTELWWIECHIHFQFQSQRHKAPFSRQLKYWQRRILLKSRRFEILGANNFTYHKILHFLKNLCHRF